MKLIQKDKIDLVAEFNIIHDFDILVNKTLDKYKASLDLHKTTDNETLLSLLLDKKMDTAHDNLITLLNVQSLIKFNQWSDRVK